MAVAVAFQHDIFGDVYGVLRSGTLVPLTGPPYVAYSMTQIMRAEYAEIAPEGRCTGLSGPETPSQGEDTPEADSGPQGPFERPEAYTVYGGSPRGDKTLLLAAMGLGWKPGCRCRTCRGPE